MFFLIELVDTHQIIFSYDACKTDLPCMNTIFFFSKLTNRYSNLTLVRLCRSIEFYLNFKQIWNPTCTFFTVKTLEFVLPSGQREAALSSVILNYRLTCGVSLVINLAHNDGGSIMGMLKNWKNKIKIKRKTCVRYAFVLSQDS